MKGIRPTYSGVAATLALVLALGGGTAVALKGKNSVDSGDIKNHQVKANDLAQPKIVKVKDNPDVANAPDPCDTKTAEFCGGRGIGPYHGWSNYSDSNPSFAPVSFWLDSFGVVHLHGEAGFVNGAGIAVFVLPPKYRPSRHLSFATAAEINTACGSSGCGGSRNAIIDIGPDGVVDASGGDSAAYSLDGVSFPAR